MAEDNGQSRLWGWDTWFNDQVLPLAGPSSGREEAQLWIFSGPLESGRNDLLLAMRGELTEAARFGDGGVEWMAREADEDAFDFQARAVEVLAGQAFPVMTEASTGSFSSSPNARASDAGADLHKPPTQTPSFFLMRDGDGMSPSWWRMQLREWMARYPTACLMVTAGQKAEPIVEAFRLAGGNSQAVFQRELTPWDDEKIAAWKDAFIPLDQRSVDELRKRTRGGWPGHLWDLLENERKEAETTARRNHLRLVVRGLSATDRECLLVAAKAPAPLRDFAEVLLQNEITESEWRRQEHRWREQGLLAERGGWTSNSVAAQIFEFCRELGDDPDRLEPSLLAGLKRLHAHLPDEKKRRMLAPVGAFEHVDREVFEALFGEPGNEMWECLRSISGVCPRGAGPQVLDPDFHAALRLYAERLPRGLERNLSKRIKDQWTLRQKEVQSEIDELEERGSTLRRRVEKAHTEMQYHEKRLANLRKRRRPRSRRKVKPSKAKRSRKVDRSRQTLGVVGIVLGIGWIYLSFIQNNGFHLYPTLGGFALLFVGFGAAFGALDSKKAPQKRPTPLPTPESAEQTLEKAIASEQHQFTLARNFHDQLFKEAARAKTLIGQLEESLRRPYLRG